MKFLHNILLFLLLSTVVGQVRAAHVFAVYQVLPGYPETTFFIHSDHLGSTSWITVDNGTPVQYLHYAPYGELIANQQVNGFDELSLTFTSLDLTDEATVTTARHELSHQESTQSRVLAVGTPAPSNKARQGGAERPRRKHVLEKS